jgi:hypothetical protein
MHAASSGCGVVDERPQPIASRVREQDLPECVRHLLQAARAARPGSEVTCIAFHTREGNRVLAHMGPETEIVGDPGSGVAGLLRAKDLLVLSVSVTETTFEAVRTVTHVLVTLTRRQTQAASGASGV